MSKNSANKIDYTLLRPHTQKRDIIELCKDAKKFGFASVCVHSYYVPLCISELKGSAVKVGTVVGFPHGMNLTQAKMAEARYALEFGAREIDMVMNIGALKDGDEYVVFHDIRSLSELCRNYEATLKVILETNLLTAEEKVLACKICQKAGADFVMTSTGFHGGANIQDIKLLAQYAGKLGVKASGGIKSSDQMSDLLEAGANRIGTSSALELLGV